jgi:DNA-binding XRE family transcriptional regulator
MYHDITKIDAEIARLKQMRKELILSNKRIKELETKKRQQWQGRLKNVIELKGVTYSEIGNEIGVSKQTISKWANMQKSIPKNRMKQLSIFLDYCI